MAFALRASSDSENPRKWRFTWEAQSHIPTLKLFLFNRDIKPSIHCKNLKVQLVLEKSLLTVRWLEAGSEPEFFLNVPVPRVLVDGEAPILFRALDDHVEVKLPLLLSVDHPILSTFDALGLSEDEASRRNSVLLDTNPLSMDSDLESLSAAEGVQFYCRNCSVQLTRLLGSFAEMPSSNWRELADNWFGACCCSFGGISEKLVTRYATSYSSASGTCLLSTTFVVLCQDDLVGCKLPCYHSNEKCGPEADFTAINCLPKSMVDSGSHNGSVIGHDCENDSRCHLNGDLSCRDSKEDILHKDLQCEVSENVISGENLSCSFPVSKFPGDVLQATGCCADRACIQTHKVRDYSLATSATSPNDQKLCTNLELSTNQKTFLNGFLGDVFMARSSNLSKDVQWVEFLCPQCSCLLGAYPSGNGKAALDGGVRLFKCYISTCLPVGGSNDLFRKYTLEKMFTYQLVEYAKDELSYRTVFKDLQTGSAMLQIVLLNPSSFHCNGYCFGAENITDLKVDLFPAIKVLYSDCSSSSESQTRMIDKWITENQADEVFMLARQIRELIRSLNCARGIFPLSSTLLQGLSLSSMRR
ncbi:uncharacterized protein LOC127804182 [Diospyros lotus]|uniref:uncharacterized protein LOC127804182 n=1 Tax=Diospyros lotus TaxID=55363 RepID=UPI00225B648C|nr:uncharacterized protein LOC127804182 [Diospyros lotus]